MIKERKYPVGSVGYYKQMNAYYVSEHLRDGYKDPKPCKKNIKFKKAIRAKVIKLNK